MVNYANGKIYQVMAKHGGDVGDVYVGSTTKEYLSQRMDGHRRHHRQWKNGKINNVTVFGIFETYGVDNCCIVLLELVNASNIDELHARERHWIQSMPCVNKVIPGRTTVEYYIDNRGKLLAYQTQYQVDNYVKIAAYKTQYQADNCVKIAARTSQYQADNRELINLKRSENILCECGCSVRRSSMSAHRKSQKHLAKLQTKGIILKQSEKVLCECGCSVRRSGMSGHRKSQKHLAKLQTKGQPSNAPTSSDSHTQL